MSTNKTKKIRLSAEERAIEKSLERDEWKFLPTSEWGPYIEAARSSHEARKKEARVNVRMSQADVDLLKMMASEEGMGYQTLLSSIIHKYVTRQFVDQQYLDRVVERLVKVFKVQKFD